MIAGMKRTGSTWQANAVRLLYEQLYGEDEVWIGEEYRGVVQNTITINKVHPYYKQLAARADYILTSYRDLWEVRGSWMRFKGEAPSSGQFKNWVDWLVEWNLQADYMMRFPVLRDARSRRKEVRILAHVLDIKEDLSSEQLEEVHQSLEALSPPEDKDYDERTLMFSNHITQDKFKND